MGVDYSICLYYELDRLEHTLVKLLEIAKFDRQVSTEIELSNGRKIFLPFTTNCQSKSVVLRSGWAGVSFDTTIVFPIDAAIQDYIREHHLQHLLDRARKKIAIGYIYLMITAGTKYVELRFTAAVSSMSMLYLNSEAVRDRFIDFMDSTHGLCGVIDIEKSHYLSLIDPQRKIYPISSELETEFYPYYDIDLFTIEVLNLI